MSDPITHQLSAANPVPSVTFLIPTVNDADEFLAIVKGLDLADDATRRTGLRKSGVEREAPDALRRDEPDERRSEFPLVDYGQLAVESGGRRRKTERLGVVLAVAAAILLVVGVVVLPDRNEGDVETEPSLSVTAPNAAAPPVPQPSVVDSLGYRWSRVPDDDGVFDDAELSSVIVGGPGLVLVGSVGRDGNSDAAVWTSVDGLAWSRVPHDEDVFGGDSSSSIDTVVAVGPGLMAYGTEESVDEPNGVLWTSADGLSWKRVPDRYIPGRGQVAFGPGLVAVGEDEPGASVWTSADGLDWSRVDDQEGFDLSLGDGNGMVRVTAGGPGLVAVGSDGLNSDAPTGRAVAVVWTSVDGLRWSRVPHDEAVFGGEGDQGMFDVAVGGPGLVAVGEDAQGAPVWTSVDGLAWARIPSDEAVFGAQGGEPGSYPRARIFRVTAAGRGLVAVGDYDEGAALWTSVDGVTWARVDDRSVFGFGLSDVTVGGPGLVAVGGATVLVATPES